MEFVAVFVLTAVFRQSILDESTHFAHDNSKEME